MIRVVIADDHTLFRAGLRRILADAGDVECVAETGEGAVVCALLRQHRPDVLILDMSLPDMPGLDVLAQVRRSGIDVRVLVVSMHPEDQYAVQVIRAGADGYVTKDSAPETLLGAVRRVYAGHRYIGPRLAEHLAESMETAADNPFARLSQREFQVIRHIILGDSISDVAKQLKVSTSTISTYRQRCFEKLGVESRSDLLRLARQTRLLDRILGEIEATSRV